LFCDGYPKSKEKWRCSACHGNIYDYLNKGNIIPQIPKEYLPGGAKNEQTQKWKEYNWDDREWTKKYWNSGCEFWE
jgi:hypothetical protein